MSIFQGVKPTSLLKILQLPMPHHPIYRQIQLNNLPPQLLMMVPSLDLLSLGGKPSFRGTATLYYSDCTQYCHSARYSILHRLHDLDEPDVGTQYETKAAVAP